jgi:hypothetical protein
MGQPIQLHLTATVKSIESLVGTKILWGYNASTFFFEIYKGGLKGVGRVTLSKDATHYGPWSGFPYYNPQHPRPLERAPTYPPLLSDKLISSMGLSYYNPQHPPSRAPLPILH